MRFCGRLYILLAWILAIFILISMSMPAYYGDGISVFDKLAHAFMFGGLAYLFIYLLISVRKLPLALIFLISALASVFYSAICEFIQIYVPGRTASDFDFIAGLIGVIIALFIAYVKFPKKRKA